MDGLIPSLEELIEAFRRLGGVGKKSAMRMAFSILSMSDDDAKAFADAVINAKEKIGFCKNCFNFCEGDICNVCSNPERDKTVMCIVEDARAVISLERVKEYTGTYHVLGGVISPMDGVGPEKLRIRELLCRIEAEGVKEAIIATNPTVEGETTAMYLAKLLKPLGVKTTRLAYGIPVGGELDHADEVTLYRAIDGRTEIQ